RGAGDRLRAAGFADLERTRARRGHVRGRLASGAGAGCAWAGLGRVVDGDHAAVRDDLSRSAGRRAALAGRGAGRLRHRAAVRARTGADRYLSVDDGHRIHLRRSRFARAAAAVGELLVTDPAVRRRVYARASGGARPHGAPAIDRDLRASAAGRGLKASFRLSYAATAI